MITKTGSGYTFGESFPSNFNAQEQDHVFPATSIVKIMPATVRSKTSKNQPLMQLFLRESFFSLQNKMTL